MSEQTALTLDTPNPSKPTARLTGGYYRPPITPMGISTVDRVEYAQNKATGLPGWAFHLAAKPGAGAVDVWFARDETNLTLFCDNHNIKLPTVGKLACNWRLEWHKAGYQNVIDAIEILPQEEPVNTAPAATNELTEAFPRDDNNQPIDDKPAAAPAWGDDNKKRGRFMGYYTDLCDAHAVPKDEREPIRKRVLKAKYGVDSLKGFNHPEPDLLKALKAEIEPLYPLEMASKPADKDGSYPANQYMTAPSQAPEAPPAGAAEASASGTPETVARATNAPSSPKKDGSTVSDAKDEIRAKYTKKLQGGKEYLEVQGRVLLFRLDHSDWTLETDLIGMTDDAAVFKCTIRNADGRIIATGHGRATAAGTKNLGSRFIEKAETAAIGRALSLASYGTDDTLEDSDYLADAPRAA